jgi:NAD(P)-dependent dehydrogenase (short-subunit alcohol dehydrogenase family)
MDVNAEGLEETSALISKKNAEAKVKTITASVSDAEDVSRAIAETVSAFGRIDYCVNSAGSGGLFGRTTDQEEETLERTLSINAKGIWLCERAQLKQMLMQELRPLK